MAKKSNNSNGATEGEQLVETLRQRFEKNMQRHKGTSWQQVDKALLSSSSVLRSLQAMEESGGEPDVLSLKEYPGKIVFVDCSAESPAGRRSLCYDEQALKDRRENKPKGSAEGMAADMGLELLTESAYRQLQETGAFDLKTSSWIDTPPAIRKLDGALFCDRRYDHVFTYHNGAQSYYAARGFRAMLVIS